MTPFIVACIVTRRLRAAPLVHLPVSVFLRMLNQFFTLEARYPPEDPQLETIFEVPSTTSRVS